jgi:hypothetical protein
MFLVKGLVEKYGHPSPALAGLAATTDDEFAVQAHLLEALREAMALVTANGRPNNHLFVVRQVLFTLASAKLTPRLRSVAGNLLQIEPRILRAYQHSLDDLVSGKQSQWFQLRGKQRSSGRFSKTSPAALEAARLHWEVTAVPSANKNDTCRNPDNSKEQSVIMYNYEPLDTKHTNFLETQRALQRQNSQTEGRVIAEEASPGCVLVVSLFSRHRPFYELLEVSDATPVVTQHLEPDIYRIVAEEETDSWLVGRIVTLHAHPFRLEATDKFAAAPIRALCEVIHRGDEPQSWKIDRRANGKFEQRSQLFNMALSVFRSCKPYFVKKGTRETCLCVHHLRWELMVEGLRRCFQKLHRSVQNVGVADSIDSSSDDEEMPEEQASMLLKLLLRPYELRSKLVCETEGGRLRPECLDGRCPRCSNFRKVEELFRQSGLLPDGALKSSHNSEDGELSDDDENFDRCGIDEEEHDDDEGLVPERAAGDVELIEYDKWEGRPARLADGTYKKKFDFFTVQVPLKDYWDDFSKFFMLFILHHDLNKDCRGAWELLQHNFRPREVALVMDAAEAHKHERRREHQSAYFQQLSSHIWVVVLYMHVEDLGNISDGERQKLLDFFHRQGKRPVVRETHYFITQDVEIKDQGGVQHVLRSIVEYLQGRGKWARPDECAACGASLPATREESRPTTNKCPICEGTASYFDQEDLDPSEKRDRQYYQGNGAPARGVVFLWLKAFSDGASQQFMCATFLFFLSLFSVLFGMCVVWNWFCSCHGKCVCDPEGGSLKAAASAYELQDSPLGDKRPVIRDARELVMFGREQLSKPSSKDFFAKEGNGVYRRFFHHISVKGRGSVNRRLVKKAESGVHLKGTMEKVKIRSIRRVAGTGFPGLLWASKRPCCDYTCPCMGGGAEGRHDFSGCKTSVHTKCVEVQLEPITPVSPTPTTRGALAVAAARLGSEAAVGDVLATETESDETPFMLVVVLRTAGIVPDNYVPPNLDIDFHFPDGVKAIEVKRFRPSKTVRGECSTSLFELDEATGSFLVPCHLLRVGKLSLKQVGSAQTRAFRGSRGASAAASKYELSQSDKTRVYELCRIFD